MNYIIWYCVYMLQPFFPPLCGVSTSHEMTPNY